MWYQFFSQGSADAPHKFKNANFIDINGLENG